MPLIAKYASLKGIRPGHIALIVLFHLVALLAPLQFTWSGLILCLILYYVTGAWGITLCFHRLLTHHSFKTNKFIRYILTFWGSMALQGGPITWVATHRLHHQKSDDEDDPHSPVASFLWSHVLWTWFRYPNFEKYEELRQYARDLDREALMRFFEKNIVLVNFLFALVLLGLGTLIGGIGLGVSWVAWGFFLRVVLVWHATWLVNSATHVWGYRNYGTTDNSRNLWWVALLSFGEGWHNNHHADQRSAAHGHRWWEFDVTYFTIRVMEVFGMAKDVVRPRRYGSVADTT